MTTFPLSTVLSLALAGAVASACASSPVPKPRPDNPTVTAQQLEQNPGQRIEDIIAAKSPGVVVGTTGDGGISVQIRGQTSFYGSNQPLYIVDDMEFRPGPNGALSGINPYDIESIKVLKNPADTGIYGMRGANGVIVVKTKRSGFRNQ